MGLHPRRVSLTKQQSKMRFRYEDDVKNESRKRQAPNNKDNKILKVENFLGEFEVTIDLVNKDNDVSHVNYLYFRNGQRLWTKDDEVIRGKCQQNERTQIHHVPELGVIRRKKKDIGNSSVDLKTVRFRYSVNWLDGNESYVSYSDPVHDTRTGSLSFVHINPSSARWNKPVEITLLCDGLSDNRKVIFASKDGHFHEEGNIIRNHKKNSALVVMTPNFNNPLGGTVDVWLKDQDDQSEKKQFTYLPEPTVRPSLKRPSGSESSGISVKRPALERHSHLVTDSACDTEQTASLQLKNILFNFASGGIKNDKKLSQIILSNEKQMHVEDDNGYTPLAAAIVLGNLDVVQNFLKEMPRDVGAQLCRSHLFSELCLTHLHLFAYCEVDVPLELFRLALNAGFSPSGVDAEGSTLLHLLVRRGRCHGLKELAQLPEFKDVLNNVNHEGQSALHEAVLHDRPEAVKALLAAGADVNGTTKKSGLTALHLVALRGRRTKVLPPLLAAKDLDINRTNQQGKTALDIAVSQNNVELQRELEAKGAKCLFISEDEDDDEDDESSEQDDSEFSEQDVEENVEMQEEDVEMETCSSNAVESPCEQQGPYGEVTKDTLIKCLQQLEQDEYEQFLDRIVQDKKFLSVAKKNSERSFLFKSVSLQQVAEELYKMKK